MRRSAFTLVELLVVLAIMAMIMGVTLVAFSGTRATARDAKRKADLEAIRSALELYRSSCGGYPVASYTTNWPASLVGDGSSASCTVSDVFMQTIPGDSLAGQYYYYAAASRSSYTLCAKLEVNGVAGVCGSASCGLGGCNYLTRNP